MKNDDEKTISKNHGLFRFLDKSNSLESKKIDLVCIIFLSSFSFIAIYFFFQNYAKTMVLYDSYKYFQTAMSIAQGTTFSSSPFILYLSALYPLFKDPSSALISLRIINVIFTVQLIIFFYLIARKMFDPILSVLGSLLALFVPTIMVFSVTLHNDIFSLAMAFGSLYFSIKPQKSIHAILATVFLVIGGLARIDIGIVFIIPYLIGISYYLSSKTGIKTRFLLLILLCVFSISVWFAIQSYGNALYASTLFEKNSLKQLITFVNFDTLKTVFDASINITGNKALGIDGDNLLDKMFLAFFSVGITFLVYKNYDKIVDTFRLKSIRLNETGLLVIYLGIVVLVYFVTLAAFHLGFHMEGNSPSWKDNVVVINNTLEQRYLMGLQLVMIYVLMYGFSALMKSYSRDRLAITSAKKEQLIYEKSLNEENLFKSNKETSKDFTNKFSRQMIRNCLCILLVIFITIALTNAMWHTVVRLYETYETEINIFYQVQPWLSEHVNENEKIFLPHPYVFWALDPTLKDNTYDYRDIFHYLNGTKFSVSPITSIEQKIIAHHNLANFVHNATNSVKYVVVDWNDQYAQVSMGLAENDLTKKFPCKIFDIASEEVKGYSFSPLYSNWESALIICQV